MKSAAHNVLIILLCFILSLILLSTAAASTRVYDSSVITGFEAEDYEKTVTTEYKYALIELIKEFPTQLSVRFGGEVTYRENENGSIVPSNVSGYTINIIDAEWKCLEDYDEDLDVFHFVPNLDKYKAAAGLEFPVITVNILGKLRIPPMNPIPKVQEFEFLIPEETLVSKEPLPTYYNVFEKGSLPPIRDQKTNSTCWAFAAIAAIEADLIHDGNADTGIDLSELHLAYYTYHNFTDEKNCNTGDTVDPSGVDYLEAGGNPLFASLTLANMVGPVPESEVPYELASGYAPGADGGRTGNVQISGIYSYDLANNRDAVKKAIMNHGAVSTIYNDDVNNGDKNYSSVYNSYYCPAAVDTNHVITLVGWDDDFSNNNFRNGTPTANGAWLVRNSWGVNGYNHSGYFWLSYYDQSLYDEAYAIDAQTWRYDHVYSYDNIPPYAWITLPSGLNVSQIFHVDGGEEISAIGFFTNQPINGLQLSVISENETITADPVSIYDPGFYLIPLPDPLSIYRNTEVTVQYKTNSDSFDACVEPIGELYFAGVKFSPQTGSGMRIDGINQEHDAKIKLFTNNIINFILPAELTSIGDEAFAGSAFRYVTLQENVISIGYHAFADCPNLGYIYIPETTTQIDPEAFGNNTGLIIAGVSGSYAETYANNFGFTFNPVS